MYMSILRSILLVAAVIVMLTVINLLLGFFGIDLTNYISYVCWFVAVILFILILPKKYKHFQINI